MARPITDTLNKLRSGLFIEEASDSFAELVQAVSDSGKPGSITLTITIKPASRVAGAVTIDDKISIKLPKEVKDETLFWATPEGNLLNDNPKQSQLPLAEVPITKKEVA